MDEKKSAAGAAKKGGLGKVLIIVGVVAVLFIILVAIGISALVGAASAPQKAARSFVETVASGDIGAAYDSTSSDFQSVTTEEDLGLFVEAYPIMASAEEVKFNSFSIENNVAVISGTITGAGEESPITFTMMNDGEAWKVVNFSLNPEDVLDLSE